MGFLLLARSLLGNMLLGLGNLRLGGLLLSLVNISQTIPANFNVCKYGQNLPEKKSQVLSSKVITGLNDKH